MWKGKKVSVIFPTYNEKESIKDAILDFFATKLVDEIVVVNNNATPGTDEEVKKTKARLVHEKKQGYGFAIQRGFKEVKGDIIIVSEPDGTFVGRDVEKLLAYHADGFEAVFGTRTTKGLIWEGANMGFLLKWGNILVAKMIELFFLSRCQLTDVGCTMRLFTRKALKKIQPQFTIGGSHFGPEMIILTLLNDINFVEIPISYLPRVGKSSVTGNWRRTIILAIQMVILTFQYRLKSFFKSEKRRK
jgi:glycosyltransferase involved in cell wall biosynthesis